MTALKAHEVERFLSKPDLISGVYLVYGSDNGRVHETAQRVIHFYAGNPPDPLSHAVIDGSEIDADPSKLAVEARTPSLFGGARTIRLRNPTKSVAPALNELLEDFPEAVIIVEAGNLTPKDALRKLAESHKLARTLPCYADNDESLNALIRSTFQEAGITIEQDVAPTLQRLLGNNREITRRELEKLCLFAHTSKTISSADVVILCGDNSAQALDAIVDAVGGGHAALLDDALSTLASNGSDMQRVLSVALSHFTLLRRMRAQVDSGTSPRDVLAGARPRPHFSRTRALERQLRQWNDRQISRACERLYETIAQTRKNSVIAQSAGKRALYAICMSAAQN